MNRKFFSINIFVRSFTNARPTWSKSNNVITPWYVKEAENSTKSSEESNIVLPNLPDNSPDTLKRILEFTIKDMGLKDVVVIDKRGDDELATGALGPSMIILGSGASTRHLGSAGFLLLSWLKKEYGIYAGREGILTTNFVKLQNRRQKRKQERQRMANDNNLPIQRVGPWIAVDTKLDNIYVHLMTAERRKEVDLESLTSFEDNADMFPNKDIDLVKDYSEPTHNGIRTTIGADMKKSPLGRRGYSTSASPVLPTREELALENLINEKRTDLTEDCDEVQNFVNLFPKVPTRENWKQRLLFFSIAAIQSPTFSLKRVLAEATHQQACGVILDNEDIEVLLGSICYHAQSHFAELSHSDETAALWQELCDYKANLLIELFNLAIRPFGRTLIGNPRLLVLLYRTFAGVSINSATPTSVLINPEPGADGLQAFGDFSRLHPLRYLLESTEEIRDIQTVGMIITSLANSAMYDAFWKVVELSTLASENRMFSEQIAELAVSLMVKSGDLDQIRFAILTYIPNSILTRNVRLTPTLVRAVESGLNIVDADNNGGFGSVRIILEQYHKSLEN